MIKTKTIYTKGFYLLESRAAANSNYIESVVEARQFMCYVRYYLKSYLVIYDYVITRHGWQMAVKVDKNLKSDNLESDSEIWRDISERVRLMLSTYVRHVNFKRGRKGVLVESNYCRYYFETLREMMVHLEKMRKQEIKLYQTKKKYRGIKYHYKIEKEKERGSIFLCSKELRSEVGRREYMSEDKLFWMLPSFVGLKLVETTLNLHNFNANNENTPNSS